MATLQERVENPELLAKVMPVEEAVKLIGNRNTLAISGFTKSGEPKTFLPALARHFARHAPDTRITLFSGASLSDDVENPLAPFIGRRGPYMSSSASRKLIHAGKMEFADVHLSVFARNLMYGIYGDIDVAVVEVSRVRPDGSVVLSSSVGISAEALVKAKKVILEVNTAAQKWLDWGKRLPPIQSGVGNVANAIVGELYNSPFTKIRFWTEVFQDGMMRYVEDNLKFECASATAVSFSEAGRIEFERHFDRCSARRGAGPRTSSSAAPTLTSGRSCAAT